MVGCATRGADGARRPGRRHPFLAWTHWSRYAASAATSVTKKPNLSEVKVLARAYGCNEGAKLRLKTRRSKSMAVRLIALSRLATVAGCVFFLGGCSGGSSNTARLSGEVTLDGNPIPAEALASVSFQPTQTSGARGTSAVIENSRYDCPDVPKGQVLVFVNLSIPTGRTYSTGPGGREEPEMKTISLIAEQRSGIEIDVNGDQTLDLKLNRAAN